MLRLLRASGRIGSRPNPTTPLSCRTISSSPRLHFSTKPQPQNQAPRTNARTQSSTPPPTPPPPQPKFLEPLPTYQTHPELVRIRHSTSHVMAMAVQKLFPHMQVTIGPWIENGFYYDFYWNKDKCKPGTEQEESQTLTALQLKQIKNEMARIIKANLPIRREEVTREEARARIEAIGEPFKLEILDSIQSEPISIYHIGDQWWDLCAGPHVESTGDLNPDAIAITSVAGAYWRGDERNAQLQRIYGTAWKTAEQLQQYEHIQEEAKRRDHRHIGRQLGLFSLQEQAGGGLVFWHPKGAAIRRCMEDFWKETHTRHGYELMYTPHVANQALWKCSGHLDFYSESMFSSIKVEDSHMQLRPMNCPFHCLVYKDSPRSYRDLPLRWAELGTVYRYERSGTLHGLMRVRGFTQDDAHIFCLPSQLHREILGVLDLVEKILTQFGFTEYSVMLSTRPEKSVGTDQIWNMATSALQSALATKGWRYDVDEGGGAFYGPKIDVKIRDAIGRLWQCSTIQCDFNLPDRFDLTYMAEDNSKQRPIMIHRAIFGSLERFFGVMIENTAGDFPLWLAPTQVRLLPVTEASIPNCQAIADELLEHGIRAEMGRPGERLAKMIRVAEQNRVRIVGIIGQQELATDSVTVRVRHGTDEHSDLGAVKRNRFVRAVVEAVRAKRELTLENVLEDGVGGEREVKGFPNVQEEQQTQATPVPIPQTTQSAAPQAAGEEKKPEVAEASSGSYISKIIEEDLRTGKVDGVRLRFPPEPNGHLHIGHAKAIWLNYGLAKKFSGTCNLRMDDTNPTSEDQSFVDGIVRDVTWLLQGETQLHGNVLYASDYFDQLYDMACGLIRNGKAYVDSQSEQEIRESRGTITSPGTDSPYRNRTIEENLDLFQRMRQGEFAEGSQVLRAKIDMSSPNMTMRDPILYRIKHASHHRTGSKWCVYPLYDYAHPLCDAIENITHSLCSLEFDVHRPLYDWLVREVFPNHPCPPRQFEFGRLNLTQTVTSKRKLSKVVAAGAATINTPLQTGQEVTGWDDPRLPTLAGLKRRGIPAAAIRRFCDAIGVSRADGSEVEWQVLDHFVREQLNAEAPRVMCVLRPLKIVITNLEASSMLSIPSFPDRPELVRSVPLTPTLYIEHSDFALNPPPAFHRLRENGLVKLRFGPVIRCDRIILDSNGQVDSLECSVVETTEKVKGMIHWVSAPDAIQARVKLYDRLFEEATDAGDEGELVVSQHSYEELTSFVEPSIASAPIGTRFQFERTGYFILDSPATATAPPTFIRITGLKDGYAKDLKK